MHLTAYTDYTLRVLMYLSMKYGDGEVATIDEMADAYGISRSHLTKIISELAQRGVIETVRGRAGGARLARDPRQISVGEVVRLAEKDLAIVECHDTAHESDCVIYQACNLKRGLRRAMDAFMQELDGMTLADAITAPSVAAPLLGLQAPGRRIPIVAASAGPAARAPAHGARTSVSGQPGKSAVASKPAHAVKRGKAATGSGAAGRPRSRSA